MKKIETKFFIRVILLINLGINFLNLILFTKFYFAVPILPVFLYSKQVSDQFTNITALHTSDLSPLGWYFFFFVIIFSKFPSNSLKILGQLPQILKKLSQKLPPLPRFAQNFLEN